MLNRYFVSDSNYEVIRYEVVFKTFRLLKCGILYNLISRIVK